MRVVIMPMTFYEWLNKQRKRDDPIGDVARDVYCDDCFPKDCDDIDKIHRHIGGIVHHACKEAHAAVDEAWFEYKHKGRREGISLKLRFKVFKRDYYSCQICGKDVKDGIKLEIDHKVPVSKGGKSTPSNLWTLCFECNRGKRDEAL